MDRLEAMSILVTAAEAGSLSAAGRRLGVPLATVSRKVSDLEAHLKTRLFDRSSRRLTLTDAGHSYVAACRRILDDVADAERAAAGEYRAPTGNLAVTAPIVFGRLHVLPIVMDFLKAFPDIDARMVFADRVIDLLDDHIDVAVRIGDLPDSSLIAAKVGSIRRVVCGSPDYFRRRGRPQDPRELGEHDCVSFEGVTAADVWRFGAGKSSLSIPIRSRLIVNTAEAAIDAALAGLGITRVLSYQVTKAVRDGALVLALQDNEPEAVPVNLVYRGNPLMPLKLRAFLDFAAPRLKASLLQAAI